MQIPKPLSMETKHSAARGERAYSPFSASLHAVVAVAAQESGAPDAALYELVTSPRGEIRNFVKRCGQDFPLIPEDWITAMNGPHHASRQRMDGRVVWVVAVRLTGHPSVQGLLKVAFDSMPLSASTTNALEISARTLATILRAEQSARELPWIATRVWQLQAEIADMKISEKARGFHTNGESPFLSSALNDHVSTVLKDDPIQEQLEKRLRDLEDRLDERRVLLRAKSHLQNAYKLSEQEAYQKLRDASRRTRQRMRVVAEQILRDSRSNLATLPDRGG